MVDAKNSKRSRSSSINLQKIAILNSTLNSNLLLNNKFVNLNIEDTITDEISIQPDNEQANPANNEQANHTNNVDQNMEVNTQKIDQKKEDEE